MPKSKKKAGASIRRHRKEVRVIPNKPFGWKVTYEGQTFRFTRKVDAVSLGTLVAGMAGKEYSVSLYVHLRNGEIEEERTYPRSADPPETPG